jgi:DNA adenine methylase
LNSTTNGFLKSATYDNAEEVKALARKHGFEMKLVPMKNTHHEEMTELLIGRDLSWLEDAPSLHETPPPYRARKQPQRKKHRKTSRNGH